MNKLGALLLIWVSSSVWAVVPVIDPVAISHAIQIFEQLRKQFSAIQDQLKEMKRQVSITQELKKTATGHYGMGELFNHASNQADRFWGGDSWQSMIEGASDSGSHSLKRWMQKYDDRYPKAEGPALTGRQAILDEDNRKTTRAASGVSSYLFEEVSKKIKSVQGLLDQIDHTDNQKAALDLNARLMAELAFIQLDMLKLETVKTQLMALDRESPTSGLVTDARFLELTGE